MHSRCGQLGRLRGQRSENRQIDLKNSVSIIIRNKKTAWVFVASVAVNVLLTFLNGRQFNLAEILGGTLGLMLVPYLLAYLVKWTCQLFKKKFEERGFNITYAVIWTIFVTVNLLSVASDYGLF